MTVRVNARGNTVEYVLAHSGCNHGVDRNAPKPSSEAGMDYYLSPATHGEPQGRWLGSGVEALGFSAGQTVDPDDLRTVFGKLCRTGQDGRPGERLGAKPRRYKTAEEKFADALAKEPDAPPKRVAELRRWAAGEARENRNYYDVTFSPQKSVSVLYAALRVAGRDEDAEKVWAAHRRAVDQSLKYLEKEAGYSRVGRHGKTQSGRSVGEYVAVQGLTATRWDHTTNRNGEPQLHSHLMILNRAECENDGQWRALDGASLYKAAKGAEGIYHLALEEDLQTNLNVEFAIRPDGKSREIIGITADDRDAASSRRAEADEQVQTWLSMYERKHGHAPSAYQVALMYERAVLATRTEKRPPADRETQNRGWGETAAERARPLEEVLADAEAQEPAAIRPELDRDKLIRAALTDLQGRRSEWSRDELIGTLGKKIPQRLGASSGEVEVLLEQLADEALSPTVDDRYGVVQLTSPSIVRTPDALRRADGRSRWEPHRYERYALADHIAAEERLYRGVRMDAPAVADDAVQTIEAAIADAGLDEEQAAAVRGVLASHRTIEVMIGPAGAGKSKSLSTLSKLWEETVGGSVKGLATSQRAANVLSEEGLDAENIAKFLLAHEAAGEPTPGTGSRGVGTVRKWLSPNTLLVVDESGMSSTIDLDRVRAVATRYGCKLLLVGDYEQLDAVGAGGALRLLYSKLGGYELKQVHRFHEEWEREASLRLRAGDTDALGEYDERGRLYGGTREEMQELAVDDHIADRMNGKSSLLIVSTNERAAELSQLIRGRMVGLGQVQDDQTVQLRDGTIAGVGDVIQSRRNDRRIVGEEGKGWVVNRDFWRVEGLTDNGGVIARHADSGVRVELPEAYVHDQVTLGYACTVHAAQGATVDRAGWLPERGDTKQHAYPASTRHRELTRIYATTREAPSDENGFERIDSTPVAELKRIFSNDQAQRAAVQVIEDEQESAASLATLGVEWQAVVGEQSRDRAADVLLDLLGPERMEQIDDERGRDRLWTRVREAELAGHDAATVLRSVVAERPIEGLDSLSDGIRWRIGRYMKAHPISDSPERDRFAGRTPEGADLYAQHLAELAEAMDRRADELGDRAVQEQPSWAIQAIGPVPEDPVDRAEWTRRASIIGGWREFASREDLAEPLGPAPPDDLPDLRTGWDRAWNALGQPESERDFAEASTGRLEEMVARWQRDLDWAPVVIEDPAEPGQPLLRKATQELQRYETKATIAAAEAAGVVDAGERDRAAARAEAFTQAAQDLARQVEVLKEIHTAHDRWDAHTRQDFEDARLARRELARRNVAVEGDLSPQQQDVRDRYLDAVGGRLDVDLAEDLVQSPAAATVWRKLEAAEAEGHDPARLLLECVEERELATAENVAATLAWRIDRWLDGHPEPPANSEVLVEDLETVPGRPEPPEAELDTDVSRNGEREVQAMQESPSDDLDAALVQARAAVDRIEAEQATLVGLELEADQERVDSWLVLQREEEADHEAQHRSDSEREEPEIEREIEPAPSSAAGRALRGLPPVGAGQGDTADPYMPPATPGPPSPHRDAGPGLAR